MVISAGGITSDIFFATGRFFAGDTARDDAGLDGMGAPRCLDSCICLTSKTRIFPKKPCLRHVSDISETFLKTFCQDTLSRHLLSLVAEMSPCLCVFGMFLRTQRSSTESTEFPQIGNLLERRLSLRRQQKYSKVSIY